MERLLVVKAQQLANLFFFAGFSIHFEGLMIAKVGHAMENVENEATEQVAMWKMKELEVNHERMVALDALVKWVASLGITELVGMGCALGVV